MSAKNFIQGQRSEISIFAFFSQTIYVIVKIEIVYKICSDSFCPTNHHSWEIDILHHLGGRGEQRVFAGIVDNLTCDRNNVISSLGG